MTEVTGKDMVDVMAEGIESYVKVHLRDQIVERLVDEFRRDITRVVSDQLAEMVFNAHSRENHMEMRRELAVLIEWTKGQPDFKKKYSMQSEVID